MRRSRAAGMIACALAVAAAVTPASAAAAADTVAGDYLVMLRSSVPAAATTAKQADRLDIEIERVYRSALHGYAGRMTRAAARALLSDPAVLSVEPDRPVHIAGQVTPTGLDRVSAPDQQGVLGPASTVDGVDQRVDADIAVIDTGSGPHPDLNVVMRTDCTLSAACTDGVGTDANGHGTHVAGTAAALDNGFGVVGVAPGARIWSVRVLGADGSGSLSGVIAGIDWVTSHADVIDVANMSIGCRCVSPTLDAALNQSVAQGVTYAVAAGNDHENGSGYSISGTASVLTTSALADFDGVSGGTGAPTCRSDIDDTLADFSNFGASVDLTAPGVCIRSTWLAGGYATISGTSMASPHVAGAAALLASQPAYHGNPGAIRSALLAAASTAGWTDDSGDGIKEPLLGVGQLAAVTLPASAPVMLSVEDGWGGEGGQAQVLVRLSRPLAGGEVVTASVASANGTALGNSDFVPLPATTVRFVAGESEHALPVSLLTDQVPEGHETFSAVASKVVGAGTADSTGTVTVYDPGGPLDLSVTDASVLEGGGSATVTVGLDAPVPSGHQVTVKAVTTSSSATAGADFVALASQTLTFNPGDQTRSLTVTVLDDTLREGSESFAVTLSSPVGARLVDTTGTISILDDEGPISLAVGNARVAEGNAGNTTMAFPVTLSAAPAAGQSVTATLKTVNSTALSGSDYVAISSTTLTFLAGETAKLVNVTVLGDTVPEPDEQLKLSATKVTGGAIADADGYGTIANDDGAVPGPNPRWLSVSDAWLTEAPGGRTGNVTLSLSTPPAAGETVQVTVASAAGTATSGSDFVAVPSTLVVFTEGVSQQTVPVSALDDGLAEPTETFTLALTSPTGLTLTDAAATVSIVSDESALQASVDDAWVLEGNAGQSTATLSVRLSAPPAAGQTVSLKVATKAGTAAATSDYVTVPSTTLTFGPGQVLRTVAVTVKGDLLYEGTEAFTVTLLTASGLSIADPDGSITLVDEEGPITASLVDTWTPEGASGSSSGGLTVRLSSAPQTGQTLSIKLGTTTGGTATASVDFLARALSVVTFATGETTRTLPVTVFGDLTGELDESVRLTASTPTGGLVIADSAADLTILNDD